MQDHLLLRTGDRLAAREPLDCWKTPHTKPLAKRLVFVSIHLCKQDRSSHAKEWYWPAQPQALLAYLGNDNTVLEPGVLGNRFSKGLVFWSQVLAVPTPVTSFTSLRTFCLPRTPTRCVRRHDVCELHSATMVQANTDHGA